MIADIPARLFSDLSIAKPTNGAPPKQRIKTAAEAQGIVHLLLWADRERAFLLAKVKGMLDGNAPYDFAELERQGQGHRANVNFREGEGLLASAETPYYDLFAESATYCQIEGNERDPDKRAEYSRIVTQHFDDMLKSWSGMDWNMQSLNHQMVAFGKGFCLWEDPTSWWWQSIRQSRVLVPDGTTNDVEELEILVVRQSITVSRLYSKIRDSAAASKAGWNTQAVMEAIVGAQPETSTDSVVNDYERYQEQIRNHDLFESVRSDVIRVANIYVKEFDGKISHLIVEERNAVEQSKAGQSGYLTNKVANKKPTAPKFLYKKLSRYNCFREVIAPVLFDIGDETWHSVKGLAVKQYPFIEIKNRLNCSIVDNAFVNMSVLLQAQNGKTEQEAPLIQLGPMTILPANYEYRQWGAVGRLEEGLVVERSLTSKLESNTGQYRTPLYKSEGNPETATKERINALKESSLNKGSVNRYYSQLDRVFEEMYIRATNFNLNPEPNGRGPNSMALKFQQQCLDDGVPKKFLKDYRYVRATRNTGNGSVFLRQMAVKDSASLVPMMNEAGRQNWLDDSIAILAGSENVTRWNPKQVVPPTIQNEQAYAMIENDVLRDGSPVQWTSTQNNFVHATTHLKAATEAINSIPQGGDPMKVAGFLEAVGQHTAIHVQELSKDVTRQQQTKMLMDQLKQLGQLTDQLKQQIEQQMQAQQQQQMQQQQAMQEQAQRTQQVLSDEQLKQIETQSKIQLSREKADANMQLRQEVHDQRLRLNEVQTRQNMILADAETATSIKTKTAKTASDIANATAKKKKFDGH